MSRLRVTNSLTSLQHEHRTPCQSSDEAVSVVSASSELAAFPPLTPPQPRNHVHHVFGHRLDIPAQCTSSHPPPCILAVIDSPAQFVSSWTLTILYRLFIRAGDPIPQRGSFRYARDYRRVNIFVIAAYLLYTIYEAYDTVRSTQNFYDLLSVPHDVSDRTLRSRFRRLSVVHHPDKAGPDAGPEAGDMFMLLKHAYDTLSDPVKRFAYDRFGSEIWEWRNCVTMYDYIRVGMTRMVPYYGGSVLVLLVLTVLGKFEMGRYVSSSGDHSAWVGY
jgi:hypothetical protein